MSLKVPIGVLALQGDFAAHMRALVEAGADPVEVRRTEQISTLRGLILPGGESTTLLKLLSEYRFDDAISGFHRRGGFLFGTCAGLILLANEVVGPPQRSLGLLDLTVRRNAYGRQVDSFAGMGMLRMNGGSPRRAEMVFIRAPRIERVGPGVEVLGDLDGEPTLVRQGRVWGSTFHPELAPDSEIHRAFVEAVGGD